MCAFRQIHENQEFCKWKKTKPKKTQNIAWSCALFYISWHWPPVHSMLQPPEKPLENNKEEISENYDKGCWLQNSMLWELGKATGGTISIQKNEK